jgi:hypothetical protein
MRALVAAIVLLCAVPAAAQDQPAGRELARQHVKTGEARFRAGDYRGALLAFLAAEAIAPSPILIHNVAVCHERLGEAAEAARRYREYLSRRPDAPNRREIEIRIAALEGAQRPPEVLPSEEGAPDGDGLSEPRSLDEPPPAPAARGYDEPFARRVPARGQAEPAPPAYPQQYPPPPYPQQQQPPPPAGYPEPPAAPVATAKRSKPLYKQWWFWVFVGVGTLILIDVASSGDGDDAPSVGRGLEIRF